MAETLEITLLGQKIDLIYTDRVTLSTLSGDKECIGYFDPARLLIYIDYTLSQDQLRRVFLHELMHATLLLSGMQNLFSNKRQEALCDMIENWQTLFPENIDQLLSPKLHS